MTEKNAEGGMTEERLAGVIAAAQSAGYASVMFPVSLVEQALAEIRRLSAANQDATAISEAWRKSAEGLNSALFRVGAERDALREALRPFVKHWQRFEAGDGHIAMDPNSEANIRVTVGDVRHARLALAPREPQPPSDIPRSEPAGRCGIPDRNGKPCIHSPDHDGRGHFGGFDDEPQPPAQSDYADRVAKVAADHFERVADSLIAHGFGERVAVAPAPIPTELAFAVKETPELKFGGLGQFRRAMGPEGSCLWTTSCPSCGKKVDMTHYDCPRGLAQPPARCTHGIADGVIGQCVMSEGHEGRDIFGNIPPAPQPADCGCVPYEKQCATHAGVPQPAAEGPIKPNEDIVLRVAAAIGAVDTYSADAQWDSSIYREMAREAIRTLNAQSAAGGGGELPPSYQRSFDDGYAVAIQEVVNALWAQQMEAALEVVRDVEATRARLRGERDGD